MFRAAFFDLDETLIDAEKAHKIATIKAFAYFGYNYDAVRKKSPSHSSRGMRVIDNLKARRDGAGISEKEIPLSRLEEIREGFFLELVKKEAILMEGAREILTITKERNIITAIVTSGTKKYIDLVLELFYLKKIIDFNITGDDVEKGKPNPECYVHAYKKACQIKQDLILEECIVFEDTKAGIIAGKNAGMNVVFIPTLNSVYPDMVKPDFQIKSFMFFDRSLFS